MHERTYCSPAAGQIYIILFPPQTWFGVTVDLTPELHALVHEDHLVYRPLHKHWSL